VPGSKRRWGRSHLDAKRLRLPFEHPTGTSPVREMPTTRQDGLQNCTAYRNHGTHAEVIEIVFDPQRVSYRRPLEF
jgi:peptide methionine sulfoxide reductase MsrA